MHEDGSLPPIHFRPKGEKLWGMEVTPTDVRGNQHSGETEFIESAGQFLKRGIHSVERQVSKGFEPLGVATARLCQRIVDHATQLGAVIIDAAIDRWVGQDLDAANQLAVGMVIPQQLRWRDVFEELAGRQEAEEVEAEAPVTSPEPATTAALGDGQTVAFPQGHLYHRPDCVLTVGKEGWKRPEPVWRCSR